MSVRIFATFVVGGSVAIGYFWHLTNAAGLGLSPLFILAEIIMLGALHNRLERAEREDR